MRLDLKLSQKWLILVSVPLLFELVFIIALVAMLQQAEREIGREERARVVLGHVDHVKMSALDAGSAAAGYSVSGASFFLKIFQDAAENIQSEFSALQRLTGDGGVGSTSLKECKSLIDQALSRLREGLAALQREEQLEGLGKLEEGKNLLEDFRLKVSNMLQAQEQVLRATSAARVQAKQRVQAVLAAGVALNILIAFGLAAFFYRGTMARLDVLMDNTRRLAEGKALKPTLSGNDEIAHLDQVFHDMAAALAEAARKERALVDNAQDVICTFDGEGRFGRVSPSSLKVWGYKPEELVGKKYTDLVAQQDSDRSLHLARKSLHGAPFESRVRRKDGAIVHMLWSAYWSEAEKSLFCVAHDITERKRAEELLRASEARVRQIIDSMPVGLVLIDEKGTIDMVNPATVEMFRYTAAELTGKHFKTLLHERKEREPEAFMASMFQEAIGRISEREAVRKDGSVFAMELSLKGYLAREGPRFLAIMLDVTERHELERLKQEFLAMVSHDLRSPLTAIQAFLTMLNEGIYGELTPKGKDKAAAADRSATRLLNLVNDLLDLDKLESGTFQMEFSDIPLSSVIDRSLDAVRAIAEQRGIILEAPPEDLHVHADGDRLVQVLVNLLGNAIKYSPQGESVAIDARPADGFVEVRVTDKGRGIPAHLKGTIFEKFKQVDIKDHKQKGGSGLGLAIAKALVEQHGGTIGVESEEGKGSSFWFRVPAAKWRAEEPLSPSRERLSADLGS
ncbi:MAG TPA: PAS domain S-box protein [Candidatus Obscuribacterales bacterium]